MTLAVDLTRHFESLYEKIPSVERTICENAREVVWAYSPLKRKEEHKLAATDKLNQNLPCISALFDKLVECPFELAVMLFSKFGQPGFVELVFSAIPSCFGYFCSSENLVNACRFYGEVMDHAMPDVSATIVSPLLNSVATFHFCESFFGEISVLFESSKLTYEAVLKILEKMLVLLPEPVLALIRRAKCSGHFQDIIWHRFLERQSSAWCRLFGTVKGLVGFLRDFFSQKQNMESVIKLFSGTRGSDVIPGFLWSNDDLHVAHLMTASDICRIVALTQEAGVLPDLFPVRVFERPSTPNVEEYFWVKHYFACRIEEETDVRFVSPDFEIYARMKMALDRLNEFLLTTSRCLRLNAKPAGTETFVARANSLFETIRQCMGSVLQSLDSLYNSAAKSVISIESSADLSEMAHIGELFEDFDVLPMYERMQRAIKIVTLILRLGVGEASPQILLSLLVSTGTTETASTILLVNNVLCSFPDRVVEPDDLALWGSFVSWCFSCLSDGDNQQVSIIERQIRPIFDMVTQQQQYCI